MHATKRCVGGAAIMVALVALFFSLTPNMASASTWQKVTEVPHRGTWFAHSKVYGPSWHHYYRDQAEGRPLRMQVTTRLYIVDKYGRVHSSNSVVKTVYNSDYVSAQATYVYRPYVSDAYSHAAFVVQHADGSWSWDSHYGPHSGPLG